MNKYFGNRAFYGRALSIATPIMAQLLIQNLVSLIDNFMVAGLGDIKMSGVNVVGQINFIFFVLSGTICSSAGIFMSQYKGAADENGMKQVFNFKLLLTCSIGVLYTTLCFIAPRKLFFLMVSVNKDSAAIIDQCVQYSRAVALSMIFLCISAAIATSLRDIEIVRPPLFINVIATLINTAGNFVLIYGNFGAPRLEVVGAGVATVFARFCELIIFVIYILIKKPPFISVKKITGNVVFNLQKIKNIKRLHLPISRQLFTRIIKKSFMILYSEMAWAVSETVSIALFNTRGGAEVVSGMAAGFAIANLFLLSCQGVANTTSIIIGQSLGANKIEESKSYKNYLLTGSVIFGTFFIALGFLSTYLIPIVYANLTKQAHIYAKGLVITMALYLPLWAFINVEYSVLRAGGETFNGVISDTIANILFMAGMFALTFGTKVGPVEMYAIVKLSDLAKVIVSWVGIKKQKWLTNLTKV